jgi:hypothetical protein
MSRKTLIAAPDHKWATGAFCRPSWIDLHQQRRAFDLRAHAFNWPGLLAMVRA